MKRVVKEEEKKEATLSKLETIFKPTPVRANAQDEKLMNFIPHSYPISMVLKEKPEIENYGFNAFKRDHSQSSSIPKFSEPMRPIENSFHSNLSQFSQHSLFLPPVSRLTNPEDHYLTLPPKKTLQKINFSLSLDPQSRLSIPIKDL